jgi:type II secretion system protein N
MKEWLERAKQLYARLAQIPRVRKVVSYAVYPLFYLFCLTMFGYCTFPYDRLKERLVLEFEKQAHASPGPAARLEIDRLGPYWFSGVAFKGVRYVLPKATAPSAGGAETAAARPTEIEIDEGHARISLLPLLIGKTSISFVLDALGGAVDGSIRTGSDERRIDLDLGKIDVGRFDPLVDLLGVPVTGTMKGKIQLVMPEQKLSKATGNIEISIVDFAAGDGKAKFGGKLALPKVQVGTLDLTADVNDGLVKITKLSAKGEDLELAGEGKMSLRDSFGDTVADLYLRFKFSDGYKGRSDVTKSLFGAPGSNAPALFELADPRIKASKRADGFYGWHMMGALHDPRFEAAAAGGSGAGGGAGAFPGGAPTAGPTGGAVQFGGGRAGVVQ